MRRKPEPQATPRTAPSAAGLPWGARQWLLAGAIIATLFVAYHPVWHAGFIWDDNGHVTRADLRPLHGLWRIWFEPGATQQYYPLLHSAFWLEYRLWGDSAACYHLLNIALHGAAAVLLFAVLRRLSLPGALLAAWAFALHPVCAESVAWISEEKNTLSAVFYFSAALAYLGFDSRREKGAYILATVLFAMALATKTVTATLPAALLVVLWWKRGRLSLRRDVAPLIPWFLLAGASGLVTAWVEGKFIGATGTAFVLGPLDRVAVAGRAIWFYLGKDLWPASLSFMYPHWDISSGGPAKFLYPILASGALAVLVALRGKSRGPLAAGLLFIGTLFPALGFINVYPFIYSYVADHFQYLALAGLMAAVAAALARGAARLPPETSRATLTFAVAIIGILGGMTTAQSRAYVDSETLWTATLARNPACWMAYQNLGGALLSKGRTADAIANFRKAIAINPMDHEALNELGVAQLQAGQLDDAEATLRQALEFAPYSSETHLNLGVVLLQNAKPDEAILHLRGVLEVDPSNARAMKTLAGALFQAGHVADAEAQFQAAIARDPDDAQAHSDYGAVLASDGRQDEAVAEYRRALDLNPRLVVALKNLGSALLRSRRPDEAAGFFRKAVEVDPDSAALHNDLGIALANSGHIGEAAAEFQRALQADPSYEQARRNLAAIQHRG
jgi:Tfp pilus assembly protein PilF